MCDCVDKLNESLKKHLNDPGAHINYSLDPIKGKMYIYISATYHKKKNNGTYENKKREHVIIPTYCCFCGKKYD